jgi:hypothetical protein
VSKRPRLLGDPIDPDEEREMIAAVLAPDTDPVTGPIKRAGLLVQLGRTHDTKYVPIIERFKHSRDPDLYGAYIGCMVRYYDRVDDHIEAVKKLVRGVPWDHSNELRLLGLQLSDYVFLDRVDKELLRLVLETFDGTRDDYDPFKQTSYSAMVTALGLDWKMLPSTERSYFDKVIDEEIVERVRRAARQRTQK